MWIQFRPVYLVIMISVFANRVVDVNKIYLSKIGRGAVNDQYLIF